MASKQLQRWIDAVDRLDTGTRPTREEMLAVARDIGLDDAVLDAAAAEAETLRTQAARFGANGLHDEACAALSDALVLQPWSLDILRELGQAQLAAWQADPSADRARAVEVTADRLIDEAAQDDVGYMLLRQVRQRPEPRTGWALLAALGGLLVLGGGALWALRPVAVQQEAPVEAGTSMPETTLLGDLPVWLDASMLPAGTRLEPVPVEVTETPDAGWIIRLGAVFHNDAPLVVSHLVATAEAFDADQNPLGSTTFAVVEDHRPGIYQGERAGGDAYVRFAAEAGEPAMLGLTVTRVVHQPGEPGTGMPVDLTWPGAPAGAALSLQRRSGGSCDERYCRGVFIAENTGTVPLHRARIRVTFPSGQQHETYAVHGRGRDLFPGEKSPFLVIDEARQAVGATASDAPWSFEAIDIRVP